MGHQFPLLLPIPMRDVDPRLIHGSLGHPSPQPKWYLDQFSHFCGAHYCDRLTDRLTDHTTRSVTVGGIHVRSTAMQYNNTNVNVYGDTVRVHQFI